MDGFNYGGMNTAMFMCGHADDEIISCGGTIHRMSRDGKKSHVITYTTGGTAAASTSEDAQNAMTRQRKIEAGEADRILGVTYRDFLEIPSQELSRGILIGKETTHKIIELMRRYRPDVVFAHYQYPDHRDHADHDAIAMRVVHCARMAAEDLLQDTLGPLLERMPIILRYGIEEEIPVNVVIEISKEDLDAKLEAMDVQKSQTRDGYLDRWEEIIESGAKLWGAKENLGKGRYAEVFYLDSASPLILGIDPKHGCCKTAPVSYKTRNKLAQPVF